MSKVLVTRPQHQAEPLVSALEQAGLSVVRFPTIEIRCLKQWTPPDVRYFAGVFFTSVNAVHCFCEQLQRDAPGRLVDLRSATVWAVGSATAAALNGYGLGTEPLPKLADAVHLMAGIDPAQISGQAFLFVRGSQSLGTVPEVIAERGGRCTELTVYANCKAPMDDAPKIKALLQDGALACLSFTSPSTVKHFFEAMGSTEIPAGTRIAAIGTTTAAALRRLGLPVDIQPEVYDAPHLAEAISIRLARSE